MMLTDLYKTHGQMCDDLDAAVWKHNIQQNLFPLPLLITTVRSLTPSLTL